MKLRDKIFLGEEKDVKNNLIFFHKRLSFLALNIKPKDKYDIVTFLCREFSLYCVREVEIVINNLDNNFIELRALAARNLFEAYLILCYVLSDLKKAEEFVLQKGLDEKQIYEGVIETSDEDTKKSHHIKFLQSRIDDINKGTAKHVNPDDLKLWRVDKLAKVLQMEDEYKGFFKLYSKYVHPSSWIIFGIPSETARKDFNDTFIIKTQQYAAMIEQRISDETGISPPETFVKQPVN